VKKPRVLFLCTGNSCRSQMAEGLLRQMAGARFEVLSAGTEPRGLNPQAVKTMKEIGIDISDHRSKGIDELPVHRFDYVITVCDKAREASPNFPSQSARFHWSIDDPAEVRGSAEVRRRAFRHVRERLADLILQFVVSETRRIPDGC
jgi:arsenate reductase